MENRIYKLENDLKVFKQQYSIHQHTLADGTSILRNNITLDPDQGISVGYMALEGLLSNYGKTTEQYEGIQAVGPGLGITNTNKSDAMEQSFLHYPNAVDKHSFLVGSRKPIVVPYENTSISVTAAGNTITIVGYNFVTNELAGALINIYDASGNFVETQTIASNTATVITIVGTWINTTAGGTFFIGMPYFMGSAEYIYHRFYTQEGEIGGIRFGVGPTNEGQNGLLFMDILGDLYWRGKTQITTITTGSQSLPTDPINVNDTAGFTTTGAIVVGTQIVNYTGITATSFTGTTGGTGSIPPGTLVYQVSKLN